MKEQKKTPEKLNDKTDNLPDEEFKALVIKMLTELRKRLEAHSENFNMELENIKRLN